MKSVTLLGLKSCDTCRRAFKSLTGAGYVVAFRDVRADPLGEEDRARLVAAFGDGIVNHRSATWRGLDATARAGTPDDLLAAHPAVMKRPVLDRDGALTLGWSPAVQAIYLD